MFKVETVYVYGLSYTMSSILSCDIVFFRFRTVKKRTSKTNGSVEGGKEAAFFIAEEDENE